MRNKKGEQRMKKKKGEKMKGEKGERENEENQRGAVSQVEKWAAQLQASRGINIQKQNTNPQKRAKKEKKRRKGAQKKHENNTNGFTTASGLGDHHSEIRN